MPGNMPINVPVQSKETEELSESGEQVNNVKFIALVDPNVVGAGIYNLKVYHKLDLIQACPDVINVYPKYDSGSNSLPDLITLKRTELSFFQLLC